MKSPGPRGPASPSPRAFGRAPSPAPAGLPASRRHPALVIGWRRGSLARASVDVVSKNPACRPPASSHEPASFQPSSPTPRGRRPERSGRGTQEGRGGGGRSPRCLPCWTGRAGAARTSPSCSRNFREFHSRPAVPRALGGAEHGRGAARALPRGPGRLPQPYFDEEDFFTDQSSGTLWRTA